MFSIKTEQVHTVYSRDVELGSTGAAGTDLHVSLLASLDEGTADLPMEGNMLDTEQIITWGYTLWYFGCNLLRTLTGPCQST
jgi:hypothetical protein